MATYVIGDVQGCLRSLNALLDTVSFSNNTDELWFVGDIVNRGPESLGTLQFIMGLGNNAKVILGNHDLYLLALHYHAWPARPAHTLSGTLNSTVITDIIEWLRHLPLVYVDPDKNCAMIHAGLYPLWTLEQALGFSEEIQTELQSDNVKALLESMYGNQPNHWHDSLQGDDRHRFIVNAFTRMRYIHDDGRLDLHHKEAPQFCTDPLHPWYEHPSLTLPSNMTLCFGHWASLSGQCSHPQIQSVDTGCVWGERLTAYRIEDSARFSVPPHES